MMVRTQLSIDSRLHERARKKAAELGLSFAEYIRRLVADDLDEDLGTSAVSVSAVFDLGSSDRRDVAGDKDELIGRAVEAAAREWAKE